MSRIAAGSERETHLKQRQSVNTSALTSACPSVLRVSDRPVLLVDVVLLLLLAATPFALVIQWCSSAGKLSDPAVSLDAPGGSLGGRQTAQRTMFGISAAITSQRKKQNSAFITIASSCYMI